MMIRPEWYAEEFPEGKSPEAILAEIKRLEREIRRLRWIIASPNYKNRAESFCPDEKVQLQMNEVYLQKVRQIQKIRQLYMASIEYTGSTRPLPDCGGIPPLPILSATDEEG